MLQDVSNLLGRQVAASLALGPMSSPVLLTLKPSRLPGAGHQALLLDPMLIAAVVAVLRDMPSRESASVQHALAPDIAYFPVGDLYALWIGVNHSAHVRPAHSVAARRCPLAALSRFRSR